MLANKLVDTHDVDIILLSDKALFYELDSGINLHQFGTRGKGVARIAYYFKVVRFIRSAIKSREPHVVFSFGELISPFVKLSLVGLAPTVFVFNRGAPQRSLRGLSGWLNPIVYPFTNGVVVQTEEALRLLKNKYRFCTLKVIPNPVELPANTPDILKRKKVIVNVGSIGRLKNQESLLRAFAAVDGGEDWELHFVGDGPDRKRLEALSKDLGLGDRVKFLGQRSDVSRILSESQLFAFTSLSEGFPNALAEGLTHGCACISFDCQTGPADLICHDVNGLLVPMGDEQQYEQELSRLLNDRALRFRLSSQARVDMQKYSPDKVMEQLEQLIPVQN